MMNAHDTILELGLLQEYQTWKKEEPNGTPEEYMEIYWFAQRGERDAERAYGWM